VRFISPDAARRIVWQHHYVLDVELNSYDRAPRLAGTLTDN